VKDLLQALKILDSYGLLKTRNVRTTSAETIRNKIRGTDLSYNITDKEKKRIRGYLADKYTITAISELTGRSYGTIVKLRSKRKRKK